MERSERCTLWACSRKWSMQVRWKNTSAHSRVSRSRASTACYCSKILPTLATQQQAKIAELAQQHRLPTAFQLRENVAAGGLMSYGANINDQFRLAAFYVDRILRGEKPADLPVQLPIKFELAINLRTAQTLGLDVPLQLQQIADEVIE